MKIAIVGKGGCGKSTITALLAKELSKNKKVLVIDGDESNITLHNILGVEKPKKEFLEYLGGRKDFMKKIKGKKDIKIFDKLKIDNLPEECITKKGNIYFLMIGKIHDFGEGCACPIGVVLREFLKSLELDNDEIVILDTEAGIEHFGRGVEGGCDIIVGIIDPTYESIQLSKKIEEIGEKLNKKVFFILNKVDDETIDLILENINKDKVIGILKNNKEIVKKSLKGDSLDLEIDEIKEIAKKIISMK
ncbi:ATP-binding protein [Methanocaldococcus indicus]|uniref:ATP-binding protein n=1 Tax=Methanocaldococcus indicus TaxID=213231 RepID=UPI003C6DB033